MVYEGFVESLSTGRELNGFGRLLTNECRSRTNSGDFRMAMAKKKKAAAKPAAKKPAKKTAAKKK
jgi:hypothetical protein